MRDAKQNFPINDAVHDRMSYGWEGCMLCLWGWYIALIRMCEGEGEGEGG